MKKIKIITLLLLIGLIFTGCTKTINKEYGKKLAGKYIMNELKTPEGNVYTKEELKEEGFEGYMELKEDFTGAYYQGNQVRKFTYDEDYLYYTSDNTKDTYEYKDGNIVLISDVGGRLIFVKE